jgi:hypothetical protein
MPPLADAVIPRDRLFDFLGAPSFAPQHRQRSSAKSAKGGSCIFRVVIPSGFNALHPKNLSSKLRQLGGEIAFPVILSEAKNPSSRRR